MNYIRVYETFIKDRRAKEPTLTGYTEKHHILPRSMGGGDDPENLIALTPEDHFFAHLLLAKIHGGQMWAPVAFMVGGSRKDYRPVQSRRTYDWVKRELGKSKLRDGAHQFDARVHNLEHRDGRKWSGYQLDMAGGLGISKAAACRLVNGKDGSASGWFVQGNRPKGPMGRHEGFAGAAHPMYRPEIIEFIHVDGRGFTGTQHGLHLKHGLSKADACRLARGQYRCAKGWYVKGKPPAKTGRGAAYKIAG
jgi:hypothetical protein